MADAAAILKQHSDQKSARSSEVETVWRDCYDYTFPLRGNGISGAMDTANSAQDKQARLMDSTAGDSAMVLAANIMSGLTPANSLWFGLDVGDETVEEKRWLSDSATLLWENIHMSNFDAEGFESCLDIVVAGMFVLYIDEDRERGGFAFQQWPLAECTYGSTRPDGRIDKINREYCLTAEQAAREFGEDKLPERMRKCLRENKGGDKFKFLHAIYPRTPYVVGAKMAKNLPFASMHIAVDDKQVVREGGYHEFPCCVPRWLRVPGGLYGVGPMYVALPTVRELNYLCGVEKDAADIAVSGMWIAKDDGILNPRNTRIGPKRIVVASDTDAMKALETGADFALSDNLVNRMQGQIRKILMADNFPPPESGPRTAYEWSVRVDMVRKLLGPIYGRLQAEYLTPMVERCFGIAFRAGVFKEPPESLRGRQFSVRYVSPMARAQKLEEVMAIEQTVASTVELAKVDPTILDELDLGKALELSAEGRGVPSSILRKPDDVRRLRAERDAAKQQSLAQQGAQSAQQVGMEEAAKRAAVA